MPQFLYWIPGIHRCADRHQAAEHGLGHAFDRAPSFTTHPAGPSGGPGTVVSLDDARLGYYPDQQDWRPIVSPETVGRDDLCWVGLWRDARPRPEDVARDELLPGAIVETDDGSRWQIPHALHYADLAIDGKPRVVPYLGLPRQKTRDPHTGRWMAGQIRAKYRDLWSALEAYELAQEEAQRQALDAGQETYTLPENRHAAAWLAFGANYRVGEAELDLLGLIDERLIRATLRVLKNEDGYESIRRVVEQKKTGPSASSAGSPGAAPSIADRPSPQPAGAGAR